MNRREFLASTTLAGLTALFDGTEVLAQSRQDTLLAISEGGPNNLDVQGVGTNRPGYEVAWNCYDRLVSYGIKTLADGSRSYDQTTMVPELAERWDVDANGITFHLRKDANFHDGTPIRAADVKWSFDRAVSVGGFPTSQMAAGSLLKPEQFSALDDYTFRVDFVRPDALTLPDIAVVVPAIYNSVLVKKNSTDKDPWGLEFTKANTAGGGAFKVDKWTPGTEVIYVRNDDWKSGPLPKLKRVIWRNVPSSGNRRALIMDAVMFGEAKPLFGAPSNTPSDTVWPSPTSYRTDVAKARALLAEAGMADGFETTISLDAGQGTLSEPIAVLIQESLAALNIRTTIEKIPGSNWRGEMLKKSMPFMINFFSGWLDYPEYFFFFTYHGQNAVFNTMGYKNPDLDQLIDTARSLAASGDRTAYEATVKRMVTLGYDQAPRIPLFQPYLSVASQKSVGGYVYWLHRQLDYRSLTKSA